MSEAAEQQWARYLPADKCYWAYIPNGNEFNSEQSLIYQAEEFFPKPIEELYCVVAALNQVRIVCAISRKDAAGCVESVQDVYFWGPQGIPDFMHEAVEELHAEYELSEILVQLNFLKKSIVSRPIKKWQRLITVNTIALAILFCVFLFTTVWIHSSRAKIDAEIIREQMAVVLAKRYPDAANTPARFTALISEKRRIQQAKDQDSQKKADLAQYLHHIMQVWPDDLVSRIDLCEINQRELLIRGSTDTLEDAQKLHSTISSFSMNNYGLQSQPLRVHTQADGVAQFQLRLRIQEANK